MFRIIFSAGRALRNLTVLAAFIFVIFFYVAAMEFLEMRQAAGLGDLGARDLFREVISHISAAFESDDSGFGVTWE